MQKYINIMQSYENFLSYFGDNFWKAIKKSLIPLGEEIDKEKILTEVYLSIKNMTYYPSTPRHIIYRNKGNHVIRSCPVFEVKDYCVYFYCIKSLENEIAINRVENTYGGWRLGWEIREKEKDEITMNNLVLREQTQTDQYFNAQSFNPFAWSKKFGEFNSNLFKICKTGHYNFVVEFDISNFYDNVRLDILEYKIREISEKGKTDEISLLLHFLNYWNRHSNFYNRQIVGLPQDEFGDCSRILANFYLQDYDQYINDQCKVLDLKYFRYADDQFIFSKSESDLNRILYLASMKLSSIGLNINQKKVSFLPVEELIKVRGFEIFEMLENIGSNQDVDPVIDYFFLIKNQLGNKGYSILNRFLSYDMSNVSAINLNLLLNEYRNNDYLLNNKIDERKLNIIYSLVQEDQKKSFIENLKKLYLNSYFNSYLYILLKFFKKNNFETVEIEESINKLNAVI